jgi:DEAD/DEAH box helicase domain-containing protein
VRAARPLARLPEPDSGLAALLDALAASGKLGPCVVHRSTLPALPPRLSALPLWLDPRLRAALKSFGIERLYSHQAEAVETARRGEDVLTVTPTASGKSLVYLLPTLQRFLEKPGSRSLLIFPYKALEQDQRDALRELAEGLGPGGRPRVEIYDGDTPERERRRIKADPPDFLITNPDMLHLGILAYHADWARYLSSLAHLVVDELHVYRGIFGCHMAHVLRRLQRLCARYGARPQLFASSATVANPGELGGLLTGRSFRVIDSSGAPRQRRHFLFVNPSLRMSPYTAAAHLFGEAVSAGYRTIAFTKARRITELIHSWVLQSRPALRGLVGAYRAGYLPEERRDIERRLFRGDLRGVLATSALELGVDIGGVDLCILVGYPGSIVSTWQRVGRAGRGARESAAVLVALPDALDQYFMSHPEEFFERGYEPVALDPANPEVARAHLVCAAAEHPLTPADRSLYGEEILGLVPDLERRRDLVRDAAEERWYALRRRPQRLLNLRSCGESFRIETASGRPVGTIDPVRACFECHEGAIYLHQAQSYRVRRMDIDGRRITVDPAEVDYYTEALAEKHTAILEEHAARPVGPMTLHLGRLRVTERVTGYARRKLFSQERLGEQALDLPPVEFETIGLWMSLPPPLASAATAAGYHFMGAIHAIEHCAISLAPLYAACDRGDLGGISFPLHAQTGGPAIFVYDGHAGGIGLSRRCYDSLEDLLEKTLATLRSCPCEEGCPSCVHSPKCGNGNKPLDKAGAAWVLEALLGSSAAATASRAPAADPAGRSAPSAPRADSQPGLFDSPGGDDGAAGGQAGSGAPARRGGGGPADAAGGQAGSGGGGEGRSGGPGGRALPPGRILVFDLETQRSAGEVGGWDKIREMGLGLAVTLDLKEERFGVYFEQDARRLVLELQSADLVVGFNLKRFDYEVLSAYTDQDLSRLATLDILEHLKERLGFRIKLDSLAEATLNERKSADGLQSLQWWKQGRLDLIEMYCKKDVAVTARLYRFGRENGYLLYRDLEQRLVRVPVEF